MDRRGCCKSYSKVDQSDISRSTLHRPDIASDPSDSQQEIYEKYAEEGKDDG
jgi:hypothetical protein